MLLAPFAHEYFNSLDLWLTPWMVFPFLVLSFCVLCLQLTLLQEYGSVVPNKYAINITNTYVLAAFLPYTTFKVHTLPDGTAIEPPSPQLLALHAACAKIAHMSGAMEILEEMFRDTDGIPVMTATDNSPALLMH